jgi:hypothetical protein
MHNARKIRAAGMGGEISVRSEAQEFMVHYQLSAEQLEIPRDHRLHLIEEKLFGHTAEEVKRLPEVAVEAAHGLTPEEAKPHVTGVAEHDHERKSLAPGKAKLGKVHLGPACPEASRSGSVAQAWAAALQCARNHEAVRSLPCSYPPESLPGAESQKVRVSLRGGGR